MNMNIVELRSAEEKDVSVLVEGDKGGLGTVEKSFIVQIQVLGGLIKRAVSELLAEQYSSFSGRQCIVNGPYSGPFCDVKEDIGHLNFRPSFKVFFQHGHYKGNCGLEEYLVSFTDPENRNGFYEFLKKSAWF